MSSPHCLTSSADLLSYQHPLFTACIVFIYCLLCVLCVYTVFTMCTLCAYTMCTACIVCMCVCTVRDVYCVLWLVCVPRTRIPYVNPPDT